jgi:hypothetical protein
MQNQVSGLVVLNVLVLYAAQDFICMSSPRNGKDYRREGQCLPSWLGLQSGFALDAARVIRGSPLV